MRVSRRVRLIAFVGGGTFLLFGCCGGLLFKVDYGIAYSLFVESAWSSERIQESQKRGNQIVSALLNYRKRTGDYPASLDALVPTELLRIPRPVAGTREWRYAGGNGTFALSFGSYAESGNTRSFYPSCSYQGGGWYLDE